MVAIDKQIAEQHGATSETTLQYAQPQVGQIVRLDAQNRPWIFIPGRLDEPVVARTTIALHTLGAVTGASVVLVFENGDPALPIVLGVLQPSAVVSETVDAPQAQPTWVTRDGHTQRVVIEAEQTLELRCGRSSISLQADGKITLKGEHIVSRARQSNKIKGGNVLLN